MPTPLPVLVTGGAGYIGSHACKALAAAGYLPVTLDDLSTGHREAVRWGPLVEGGIGDEALVRRVVGEHRIEAVLHFAASAYVGESVTNPRKYLENNVVAGVRMLNALVDGGVRRVIFSSSCATYGVPAVVPIVEETPQIPINPYGDTKLYFEKILRSYDVAYGVRTIALRYFNAAGADVDGELGEEHSPETHLVPNAILAALGFGPPLRVFGTDYPTKDGTAERDYIHVSDLAEAHVRALRMLLDGAPSGAFNLGTGQATSVQDVVEAVGAVTGRPVPHGREPRRPGDPPVLVADPSRFHRAAGFMPTRSDLRTIIQTATRWHREHPPKTA